jgi:hypothetical protein
MAKGSAEQPWTFYHNGNLVTAVILAAANRPILDGMPPTNSALICIKKSTGGDLGYEWWWPGLGSVATWDHNTRERLISVIDP